MADSVDMLGDALVYAMSLYVIDRTLRWQAGVAFAKGLIILGFGLWIIIEAALKLTQGSVPISGLMAVFGALALVANLVCLRLLWPLRSQDVNIKSTFECSRNDVIRIAGTADCRRVIPEIGIRVFFAKRGPSYATPIQR